MSRILGLRRGTVRLSRHHASWKRAFSIQQRRIAKALGPLVVSIEHVGSTAVPGLSAKPVLDIVLGVRRVRTHAGLDLQLSRIGYRRRPTEHGNDVLYIKGPESDRTAYLHVVRHGGALWKKYVGFRDWMRDHPGDARDYASLKRKLQRSFADDRTKYTIGKHRFITRILRRIP